MDDRRDRGVTHLIRLQLFAQIGPREDADTLLLDFQSICRKVYSSSKLHSPCYAICVRAINSNFFIRVHTFETTTIQSATGLGSAPQKTMEPICIYAKKHCFVCAHSTRHKCNKSSLWLLFVHQLI